MKKRIQPSMLKELKFPKNFLWGTATSSYQVEGGIRNDWSRWEKSKARLEQLKREGKNPSHFINKNACNHYNLYKKDFDFAKQLRNNSHRFSVEWARIEPEEGRFSQKEIKHYKKIVLALKARKIEPFLTAHHFTLPAWLSDEGGWLSPRCVRHFEDYVSRLALEFRNVRFWITINEPVVLAYKGYWKADWPPCKKSRIKTFRAIGNMIKAHKKAYRAIHEFKSKEVGIAKNIIYFMGLLRFSNYFYNWHFLDSIYGFQDFIGVNYYTRKRVPREKSIERSDMGWAISPRGLYLALRRIKHYNLPVYITENGISDSTDEKRPRYIVKHLKQVHNALKEGIDVRGYFYWSLLDNFEWDSGFTKRFGLLETDYRSMSRKPRNSFYLYRGICSKNSLGKDIQKEYL